MSQPFVYDMKVDPSDLTTSHGIMCDMVGYHKRILEIGCATGYLTKEFRNRGCSVVAIERHQESAEKAQQFAERVIIADLNDTATWGELNNEQFDIVVAGDVLEHLNDPLAVLRRATQHLVPTGTVVISLPNIAHADVRLALLAGRFDYGPFGLLDSTHLRFFTMESVKELLREAGLVPVEIRRVIVPIFESEIKINRGEVSARSVVEVLRDPEAETYQFVIRAVPDNGTQSLRTMAEQIESLQNELYVERVARVRAEEQLATQLEQVPGLSYDREELARLRATKILRWSAGPRRAWGKIKTRGGQRSEQ